MATMRATTDHSKATSFLNPTSDINLVCPLAGHQNLFTTSYILLSAHYVSLKRFSLGETDDMPLFFRRRSVYVKICF